MHIALPLTFNLYIWFLFLLYRCGYKKVGGQIVTKHDREMSERSNGRRMMEFPPGIHTGDGAALNGPQIQVSNSVYNKIRQDFSSCRK
jgi:hypothetical protein